MVEFVCHMCQKDSRDHIDFYFKVFFMRDLAEELSNMLKEDYCLNPLVRNTLCLGCILELFDNYPEIIESIRRCN